MSTDVAYRQQILFIHEGLCPPERDAGWLENAALNKDSDPATRAAREHNSYFSKSVRRTSLDKTAPF